MNVFDTFCGTYVYIYTFVKGNWAAEIVEMRLNKHWFRCITSVHNKYWITFVFVRNPMKLLFSFYISIDHKNDHFLPV